jgi:pimeloyl-ACP methyl ester carboxylesterase
MNQAKSVFKSDQGKAAILGVYDMLLNMWPIPIEKLTVGTRHGDTFIVAGGDTSLPSLVLLHGSGSNAAMWMGDMPLYAQSYRVYAIDLPGEPGRSSDIRPSLSGQDYADWLIDVFDALKIDKASIVGISLGGWTALKFAIAHPERMNKLALLCPAGIGKQKLGFILYAMVMKLFGERGKVRTIKRVMGIKDLASEIIEYSHLINSNFTPYKGIIPLYSDSELKSIKCPTLLVAAGKDIIINGKKTAERARKNIRTAEVVLLQDSGHGLIDQKDKIMSFLNK